MNKTVKKMLASKSLTKFIWKSTLMKVIIEDKCSILHKERKVKRRLDVYF